jgi:adenosylcobyric acid synthase
MKSIMVVGTTSNAGKSFLTAALCRIFYRQGWRVAPFKGQNMALNSYVTASGGEIGHAQAVQAWAAGISPWVEMNPILLKPQGNMTSQVIIKGKVVGTTGAVEYYEKYFDLGWKAIQECLFKLQDEFDLLICEGAGSPAEINLKHRDLTNMRVAKYLNAATILIVDIDRGGAFAHVVGTLELLEPDERSLIKGIVINKFRGLRSLLDSGINWLEKRTGIPVLGVIPWVDNIFPPEDSLSLLERRSSNQKRDLTIGVIKLPHIANFTDFDPLEAESSVTLKYIYPEQELGHPDALIIPGSKTTIADLLVLQKTGMLTAIKNYVLSGGNVLGICGGFQMLGKYIIDADGLEGEPGKYKALDLLPIKTTMTEQKITRQRSVYSHFPQEGLPVLGYEIHQGKSQVLELQDLESKLKKTFQPEVNYKYLFNDKNLGIVDATESVFGTYLHGIFDNGAWRRSWLNKLRQQRGLSSLPTGVPNYREEREILLNSLADVVETHVDLKPIL